MRARAEATFVTRINVRASHFTDSASDIDGVCRLCGSGEKESLLQSARPRSVSQSRWQVGPSSSAEVLRRGLLYLFLTGREGVEVLHTRVQVPTICTSSVHMATFQLGGVLVSLVSLVPSRLTPDLVGSAQLAASALVASSLLSFHRISSSK